VPALLLGHAALERGALAGLRLDGRVLGSVVDVVFGPLTALAAAYLPWLLLFASGVLCLLGSFRLFDVLLPDLQGRPGPVARVGAVVFRPWFMFLVGLGVTALTLSVSVSLSLLVPLASRGYLRRENAAPYILGANITTFIDTLLAAALVGHADAVRVVAVMMGSVTLLSLPLVLVVPHRFERLVDRVAVAVTARRRSLAAFALLLFLTPVLLIAL
jgi:Na+/phosphate symporter